MSELKACPFCGEIPETSKYGVLGNIGVRCENINCSQHTGGFMFIETWNTRPIEDALADENKQLNGALLEIKELYILSPNFSLNVKRIINHVMK
jgi:hypothetical protein